jgi:RHH-type proline utilization regulon transcriptional repressor/proline dehydrogenase/delta 1-pyrroline-5-carboxylate dehydrogenase
MAMLALWQAEACCDEEQAVAELLQSAAGINADTRQAIVADGRDLVQRARAAGGQRKPLDALLQEFGLSNPEGVALMCLAESLLRIPDSETADRLIAEKVRTGDWASHRGRSESLFVNASVWGMLLAGKVVRLEEGITREHSSWLRRLVSRLGEPGVRAAMLQAMRLLGRQYVLGRNIGEAVRRGTAEYPSGTAFSFDMLGEGARTAGDAERYSAQYEQAIQAVAIANAGGRSDSVSIKLSALHPRYHDRQRERVLHELLPRLIRLTTTAAAGGVGLTIDAEEGARLPLSLDLFERLLRHPELAGWNGLGLVVQAYQKRAPVVIEWVVALARATGRRIPVRLVKGAYWDSEIKHAQQLGLPDYPVYTRKANTDLAWLVCAQKLIAAGELVYPQFATHNAYSMAAILHLTRDRQGFELQRLHGMGDLLYVVLREHGRDVNRPTPAVRVYAPVGAHRELLPYLVRRLLENGANGSFVNQLVDARIPAERLVQDIVAQVAGEEAHRHPGIPRPPELYRRSETPRANADGLDLDNHRQAAGLMAELARFKDAHYTASSTVQDRPADDEDPPVSCPAAPTQIIGHCRAATFEEVTRAMAAAAAAQPTWDASGGAHRASVLEAVGRALDEHRAELIQLICREAGRTPDDALSEVREAIDFCHYYAALARRHFASPQYLTGPTGERNRLSLHGRGVFACISPWNFPLAIFTGQTVAALAAGNAVAAKPAEQTPLVAARAVALMHASGVPREVLQFLPGDGSTMGSAILRNEHLAGVAFTGSTATAKHIQRVLAEQDGSIVPLIAETGGLNAMIADTSCLPEQLVDDVIASAFMSAGQRCSALRVLFLPEVIAESVLEMLTGACEELALGDPLKLATDIGPVIDPRALAALQQHMARMHEVATVRYAYPADRLPQDGYFFGPQIVEIENMALLEREVFGPILHVVRYAAGELEPVLEQINRCGYGLTLGVHTRIEGWAEGIFRRTRVGNTYVNRNMVGAVVGVNPFGGEGLSGTGPKAGGPHYLFRFATERTMTVNTAASGGNVELLAKAEQEDGLEWRGSSPLATGVAASRGGAERVDWSTVVRGYN